MPWGDLDDSGPQSDHWPCQGDTFRLLKWSKTPSGARERRVLAASTMKCLGGARGVLGGCLWGAWELYNIIRQTDGQTDRPHMHFYGLFRCQKLAIIFQTPKIISFLHLQKQFSQSFLDEIILCLCSLDSSLKIVLQ